MEENENALTALLPTEMDLLNDIDKIIVRSLSAGDPLIACEYGNALQRTMALKGLGLAKLLHAMQSNWETFQASGIEDEFEDFVEAHMGTRPQTSRKYAAMWRSLFENPNIPDEIKQQLQMKPIKELLLLVAAADEGSLNQDDWKTVMVSDDQGIRDVIHRVRGTQTSSSNAVRIFVVMRDTTVHPAGTILSMRNNMTERIGSLELDHPVDFAKQAVNKILNSAGIQERR